MPALIVEFRMPIHGNLSYVLCKNLSFQVPNDDIGGHPGHRLEPHLQSQPQTQHPPRERRKHKSGEKILHHNFQQVPRSTSRNFIEISNISEARDAKWSLLS